jgi:hypothetical protein
MATVDRITGTAFWPTTGKPSRKDFVGSAACRPCHASQAASQPATPMALTAKKAESSDVLRLHERLKFRSGAYSYDITTRDGRSLYTVTDGARSTSSPLGWAFGVGRIGQTYLFEKSGVFHESRVSYYESLQGLDFTPARALQSPGDLEEAMARPVQEPEARRCFGCHTTASTSEGVFDTAGLTPGVTCEACHGPARQHVDSVSQGRFEEARAKVLNPAKLDPSDSVDFCGACHATFWDVTLAGEKGIAALRSQPFRLQSSRCWGKGDARLTCIACHDPHQPLVRDAAAYDRRCSSCHGEANDRPVQGCRVGTEKCVTCHMPKYDAPEMHYRFTDHQIRIVRSGQ